MAALTRHEQTLFDFSDTVRSNPAAMSWVLAYKTFQGIGDSRGCLAVEFDHARDGADSVFVIDALPADQDAANPVKTTLFHLAEPENTQNVRRIGQSADDKLVRVETLAIQSGSPLAYRAVHNLLGNMSELPQQKLAGIELLLAEVALPPAFGDADPGGRPRSLQWSVANSYEMAVFYERVLGLNHIAAAV